MIWAFTLVLSFLAGSAAFAQGFETDARAAILVDYETGTVLFEKNADVAVPPASMSKLMTMAVVFRALKDGGISLDDEFEVSEHAWRTGGAVARGATMFAELGSSIPVADLLRGAIVQTGNDSCIILAEGMAGSEEGFAKLMEEEADEIGLAEARFGNSTGLPNAKQLMSARDLAILAAHVIRSYPDYYAIYAEPDFTWNGIYQKNKNPLLAMNVGADGLVTGFAEESGYGATVSAVRDGRRLIAVVGGASSDKTRLDEVRRLLEWGFSAFDHVELFAEGEIIAEVKVFGGESRHVGVTGNGPIRTLLPIDDLNRLRAVVAYRGPLVAPIKVGQPVGVIKITTADGLTKEQPVFAAGDVEVGSLTRRAMDGLEELFLGLW